MQKVSIYVKVYDSFMLCLTVKLQTILILQFKAYEILSAFNRTEHFIIIYMGSPLRGRLFQAWSGV